MNEEQQISFSLENSSDNEESKSPILVPTRAKPHQSEDMTPLMETPLSNVSLDETPQNDGYLGLQEEQADYMSKVNTTVMLLKDYVSTINYSRSEQLIFELDEFLKEHQLYPDEIVEERKSQNLENSPKLLSNRTIILNDACRCLVSAIEECKSFQIFKEIEPSHQNSQLL